MTSSRDIEVGQKMRNFNGSTLQCAMLQSSFESMVRFVYFALVFFWMFLLGNIIHSCGLVLNNILRKIWIIKQFILFTIWQVRGSVWV